MIHPISIISCTKNLHLRRSVFLLTIIFSLWATSGAVKAGVALNVGDIVSSSNGTDAVVLTDPVTGAQTALSSGGLLSHTPDGVVAIGSREILVSVNGPIGGNVVRIDPLTGTQTLVASGISIVGGITVEPSGDILISDLSGAKIVRVNPATGASATITSAGNIDGPRAIAVEANGNIIVTSRNNGRIVRVHPTTGAQTIVSSAGILGNPQWLAVNSAGDIFVTTGNSIVKINPGSGGQSLVASGGQLLSPQGIAVDANGDLVVANGNNKILRVNPDTASVVEIAGFGVISGNAGLAIFAPLTRQNPFAFRKIADNDTLIPGETFTYESFAPPSLDNGKATFYGFGFNSDRTRVQQGIYSDIGGTLNIVADGNTPLSSQGGQFAGFSSELTTEEHDLGIYGGGLTTDGVYRYGIFVDKGAGLNFVVGNDRTTPVPGDSGVFVSAYRPSLDEDNVAFHGYSSTVVEQVIGGRFYRSNVQGIYSRVGDTFSLIADTNTSVPGGEGNFLYFCRPVFESGSVAFGGYHLNSLGQYRFGVYNNKGGFLRTVADFNTPIPGEGGHFEWVDYCSVSADGDQIAFVGQGRNANGAFRRGIYAEANGSQVVLVDNMTPIPGGTENFPYFNSPALNNGNVAFRSYRFDSVSGQYKYGIFLKHQGRLFKVIEKGDILEGKTVLDSYLAPEALNGATVGFRVFFDELQPNGHYKEAVYLASLDENNDGFPDDRNNCSTCNADNDGDGILDIVDGEVVGGAFVDQSTVTSTKATDQGRGGTSFLTVKSTGGLALEINDAANPTDGLQVNAISGTGKASLEVCGLKGNQGRMQLTSGGSVIVTCGSATVQVLTDDVEILLGADDESIVITLPNAVTATVKDTGADQFEVENDPLSPQEVRMTLNGATVTVPAAVTAMVTELSNGQFLVENSPDSVGEAIKVSANGQVVEIVPGGTRVTDLQGPLTSSVIANPNPVPVNTGITLTATVDDTFTGGSNISAVDYTADAGARVPMDPQVGTFNDASLENVTAGIPAFFGAGVHHVCVEGTDGAGNRGPKECILLAIYDPDGGFVTGGGWISSPPGAYTADPSLIGKANFGFVSKYKKGATIPTGVTEFQFKVANLNFYSNTYEWLAVSGARAQYKGTGTINGSENYGFLLTAIDGAISGGGGIDKLRIKIWDKTNDTIVYDNQLGADDTGKEATSLGGGSIVIHAK